MSNITLPIAVLFRRGLALLLLPLTSLLLFAVIAATPFATVAQHLGIAAVFLAFFLVAVIIVIRSTKPWLGWLALALAYLSISLAFFFYYG